MVMGVIAPEMIAGVLIGDNWWVNARQRSPHGMPVHGSRTRRQKACLKPTGPAGDRATGRLRRAKEGCGRRCRRRWDRVPLPGVRLPTGAAGAQCQSPKFLAAVKAVSVKYRDSMVEIIAPRGSCRMTFPAMRRMSEHHQRHQFQT